MTKNTDRTTDKRPGTRMPVTIESGWGVFLMVWAKAIAMTIVVVLILKYIFKVPISI